MGLVVDPVTGFLVDEDSGIVVEDVSFFSGSERAFDADEFRRRSHHAVVMELFDQSVSGVSSRDVPVISRGLGLRDSSVSFLRSDGKRLRDVFSLLVHFSKVVGVPGYVIVDAGRLLRRYMSSYRVRVDDVTVFAFLFYSSARNGVYFNPYDYLERGLWSVFTRRLHRVMEVFGSVYIPTRKKALYLVNKVCSSLSELSGSVCDRARLVLDRVPEHVVGGRSPEVVAASAVLLASGASSYSSLGEKVCSFLTASQNSVRVFMKVLRRYGVW